MNWNLLCLNKSNYDFGLSERLSSREAVAAEEIMNMKGARKVR